MPTQKPIVLISGRRQQLPVANSIENGFDERAFNSAFLIPTGAGASTNTVLGMAAPTLVGTPNGGAMATTSALTRVRRTLYSTAATAGAVSGAFEAQASVSVGAIGSPVYGGFELRGIVGTADAAAVAGARWFYGLSNNVAAPTNVDPSTLINCVGLARIAASNNLQIVYGGSTAQTPVDLGANFPANTLGVDIYRVIFTAPPNVANQIWYEVYRLGTSFVASGTLTGVAGTAIPANTTLMAWRVWVTNNATALTAQVAIGRMSLISVLQ